MFGNFIGGGQVFLHKVRMFWQVFTKTIHIALLLGMIASCFIHTKEFNALDHYAFLSYRKAVLADSFDGMINEIRLAIGNKPNYITYVAARTDSGVLSTKADPRKVIRSPIFSTADSKGMKLILKVLIWSCLITSIVFTLIFLLWSKLGKDLKTERLEEGIGRVLTAKEAGSILRRKKLASPFKIGDMPLVKDMETGHFLVTGSTGSGKTNLVHNLLPQVESRKQPAIIIDQTGEMISKYYSPERGDIIFNPFDERGMAWDFWTDCASREDLERFSKILISFNRRQSGSRSDPFWENAAESVFNSCVEFLRPRRASIEDIVNTVCYADIKYLRTILAGSKGARYVADESKQTASSIVSVLAADTKPLSYLPEILNDRCFSMKTHFTAIKNGSTAWLFLSTKPSSRSLTLPLIACLTELAFTQLMEIGIDKNRRVWMVIDELPALGVLPALSSLMTEGRKYGACVIACMQSLNQLFDKYGQYEGSYIFGQFGTSFFFRNTEPAIAKMISAMCGTKTITRQQKNTSFGAHEFRDGVSYSEQQQKSLLVEIKDLANLGRGECYTLSAEPAVRLAKIQTPKAVIADRQEGFVQKKIAPPTIKEKDYLTLPPKKQAKSSSKTAKSGNNQGLEFAPHSPAVLAKDTKKQNRQIESRTINNEKPTKSTNDFIPEM